jgi:ribonucleoside-diphosphate reductase beta chain
MENNGWYPEECNLSRDIVKYKALSDEQKYAYDMALAQLVQDDSVQTHQLVEDISKYITSPVVKSAITLQAYQEANHSRSYSVTAETVVGDPDKIYNLYKTEPMLARKNEAVFKMYENITADDKNPTTQELLIAFAANQILEELVFPGGFVVLWSFGFPGTSTMISFIQRDETGTHVPLFRNIFRTAVKENSIEDSTIETISKMIVHMCEEEKIWTKHITKALLGFSEAAVDLYVEYFANSVCKNLNIPLLYPVTDGGPLMSIVEENSLLTTSSSTKSNFFETAVVDYSKNSIDDDY